MPGETLHSLSELRELVLDWLDVAGARSIVEVGADAGAFTGVLAAHAEARGGTFTSVEPAPTDALRAVLAAHPHAVLVPARSPGALARVPAPDAWIVDGDHNHFTVRAELDAISASARAAGRPPVVVLHDVAWPCARRDFYYDAGALPAEAVLPHARGIALAPDEPGTAPAGLRLHPALDVAVREGGPRNGVLTAVEEFRAATPGWRFARVPLVFGVGVLWPEAAPFAAALAARVAPWDEHPVLARVERNRAETIVRLDALALEHGAALARAADAERRAAAAEARAAAAGAREAEAERRAAAAEGRAATLEASLAWRVAVRARVLRDRVAPEGSAPRRALAAGLAVARDLAGRIAG